LQRKPEISKDAFAHQLQHLLAARPVRRSPQKKAAPSQEGKGQPNIKLPADCDEVESLRE
jgi:hypothetical protein